MTRSCRPRQRQRWGRAMDSCFRGNDKGCGSGSSLVSFRTRKRCEREPESIPLTHAPAGASRESELWIPAFAGMTKEDAGGGSSLVSFLTSEAEPSAIRNP